MKWKNSITFFAGLLGAVVSLVTLYKFFGRPDQSRPGMQNKIQANREPIAEATRGTKYNQMRELLLAQAIHETGIFTSRIFKEKNNLFGMKVPKQRRTLATNQGTGETYADYLSPLDSAKDLVIWLQMHNAPAFMNVNQYVQFLKSKGYFTDTVDNYANAVSRHLKKYGIV